MKTNRLAYNKSGYNKEKQSTVGASLSSLALREIKNLLDAIWNGRLNARIDVNSASGEDRKILEDINLMLDAGVGALGVSVVCIEIISKSYI